MVVSRLNLFMELNKTDLIISHQSIYGDYLFTFDFLKLSVVGLV